MTVKTVWGLLKETISDWSEDKASRLAASLAYYTTFSIAPLLIIVIAIAGLVFGREAVQGQIETQIQGLVGEDSAELIQEMIQGASNRTAGTIATIIVLAAKLNEHGLAGINEIWGA